ncbi:MAG: hypothetical protein KAS32_27820 [Candidatus Peribacteraceae bacterium]|nr:hypothetical protein [Candidatus Peribacteraceae bacterium]
MARLSGYGGALYAAPQVVDAAEVIWSDGDVTAVAALDTTDYKVGTASARVDTVATGATTRLMFEDFAALNLTGYTKILCWIKSSVVQALGDCQFLLDDVGGSVVPTVEQIDIPVLVANVWKFCSLTIAVPAACGAIISCGLYQVVNLADMSMWIDAIDAARTTVGIREWSMDIGAEVVDSSGFSDGRNKVFTPVQTEWGGSFNGFKDGAPLAIGTVMGMELQESAVATEMWRGSIVITNLAPASSVDGLVTYNYTFQGIHALEWPTT